MIAIADKVASKLEEKKGSITEDEVNNYSNYSCPVSASAHQPAWSFVPMVICGRQHNTTHLVIKKYLAWFLPKKTAFGVGSGLLS